MTHRPAPRAVLRALVVLALLYVTTTVGATSPVYHPPLGSGGALTLIVEPVGGYVVVDQHWTGGSISRFGSTWYYPTYGTGGGFPFLGLSGTADTENYVTSHDPITGAHEMRFGDDNGTFSIDERYAQPEVDPIAFIFMGIGDIRRADVVVHQGRVIAAAESRDFVMGRGRDFEPTTAQVHATANYWSAGVHLNETSTFTLPRPFFADIHFGDVGATLTQPDGTQRQCGCPRLDASETVGGTYTVSINGAGPDELIYYAIAPHILLMDGST